MYGLGDLTHSEKKLAPFLQLLGYGLTSTEQIFSCRFWKSGLMFLNLHMYSTELKILNKIPLDVEGVVLLEQNTTPMTSVMAVTKTVLPVVK